MYTQCDAQSILRFHDGMLAKPEWPSLTLVHSDGGLWQWIATNHLYNSLLWNEEDKARRTDVGAAAIAASKRLIDQYNQKRNDAIEAMDEAILLDLGELPRNEGARLNSETAGSMIDRLSILSLKIVHMREQTQRADADEEHRAQCKAKLERLTLQRTDLANCFDALLTDARAGRAYFKVYRQFKMYNDPTLNPWLYGGQGRQDVRREERAAQ
jgi:hypothetical protein